MSPHSCENFVRKVMSRPATGMPFHHVSFGMLNYLFIHRYDFGEFPNSSVMWFFSDVLMVSFVCC